jgi:hypothetical protein
MPDTRCGRRIAPWLVLVRGIGRYRVRALHHDGSRWAYILSALGKNDGSFATEAAYVRVVHVYE